MSVASLQNRRLFFFDISMPLGIAPALVVSLREIPRLIPNFPVRNEITAAVCVGALLHGDVVRGYALVPPVPASIKALFHDGIRCCGSLLNILQNPAPLVELTEKKMCIY